MIEAVDAENVADELLDGVGDPMAVHQHAPRCPRGGVTVATMIFAVVDS